MRTALLLVLLSFSAEGCATVRNRGRDPLDMLLTTAGGMLGSKEVKARGQRFRADCSGFVTACFFGAGQEIGEGFPDAKSGTEAIFLDVKERGKLVPKGRARAGDLAFFHNTYDRNGNGLRDDRFTHVALVVAREADGTLVIAHFASGRVKEDRMHPGHPRDAVDPHSGAVWNSPLRAGGGRTTTGELLFRIGRLPL